MMHTVVHTSKHSNHFYNKPKRFKLIADAIKMYYLKKKLKTTHTHIRKQRRKECMSVWCLLRRF